MGSRSDVATPAGGSTGMLSMADEADGDELLDAADEDAISADHRRGPRRRGDALTAAIFDATLAELAEVGYAELTMERVAGRAKASKGSLYRRWSNRAE